MPINRVKFWVLAFLLFCYLAGILLLSAVNSRPGYELPHQQISKSKNFEHGVSAFRPVLKRSRIHWCSKLRFVDPPGEPIALASFPGSGNTWLRYLLQQATGFYTGAVYKDLDLLKNGFPGESITNGSVLVVKTHEWGTPAARARFTKTVLLVRSPLKAIQAEFNRLSGGHIGFAAPDRYRRLKGRYWQQFFSDKLRGWQAMNLDWLYNFTGPTHVIFYDQLVENTEHTLRSVINFVNVPLNPTQFTCAIGQKEGIYRRKKKLVNFDPFTEEMKIRAKNVQEKVYEAIYNFAIPERKKKR